jgi:hypothetical protein
LCKKTGLKNSQLWPPEAMLLNLHELKLFVQKKICESNHCNSNTSHDDDVNNNSIIFPILFIDNNNSNDDNDNDDKTSNIVDNDRKINKKNINSEAEKSRILASIKNKYNIEQINYYKQQSKNELKKQDSFLIINQSN